MVNKIISVMIFFVIGLALLPVVNSFATNLTTAEILDVDGVTVLTPQGVLYGTTTGSLVDLLPVIYVIILLAGAVGYIVVSKRSA